MERDVLVVHPYKNHVYHNYLGVAGSGSYTTLVNLFYRKGLFGRLASLLSKDFSAKAKDYYDRNIPLSHVHSPAWRQIRYMYERKNSSLVIRRFDTYCAGNILSGRWEAAASGLPLLITPYVGIDTFVDERHGFLIDGGDCDLLSRALLRAFESRHHWEEMGRSARALACDHPWKRFEEDISKLYKERILPQYA